MISRIALAAGIAASAALGSAGLLVGASQQTSAQPRSAPNERPPAYPNVRIYFSGSEDVTGDPPAAADAGEKDAPTSDASREELRVLVETLRARAEQEAQRSKAMLDELSALREQFAEAQAAALARQEERERRVVQLEVAMDQLRQADGRLAQGERDVDGQLRQAAQSLSGQAAVHISAAREALARGDLFEARAQTELAMLVVMANQATGINEPLTQP
jgi:hypothetical protein